MNNMSNKYLLYNRVSSDTIELIYNKLLALTHKSAIGAIPYIRRIIRLLALPYLIIKGFQNIIEPVPRWKIISDILYIFFELKYYPDNYFVCKLWEVPRNELCYYYGSIYDPYQRRNLRKHVHSPDNIILFENKYICYLLCKSGGFPVPTIHELIFPGMDYHNILLNLTNRNRTKKYVVKIVDGKGGKGVAVMYYEDNKVKIKSKTFDVDLNQFELNVPAVVQDYVYQHSDINKLSKSVNTIRIVTVLTMCNDVIIAGAYLRVGTGESVVDNLSSGGMGVEIDTKSGCCKGVFFDRCGNRYDSHPTKDLDLRNFAIPHWDKVITLVGNVQKFFFFHKLIGFDIAITQEGPFIIELNAEPDLVDLEMICGPILKNKVVWKGFMDYGLLINAQSKKLYNTDGAKDI